MNGRDHPMADIRQAVNRLLKRNHRTDEAEAGEMYLGKDVLVVRLKRPKIIEGQWRDLDATVDVMDLIDMYDNGGNG